MSIRLRELKIAKKRIGHVRVVVLSGMDHERLKLLGPRLHRGDDRRNLHEVGPRPNDIDYFNHGLQSNNSRLAVTSNIAI